MKDFISNLQKKPYETKIRILWGTGIVAGIILVVVWVFSLKNTIQNAGNEPFLPTTASVSGSTSPQSQTQFVSVERVEKTTSSLKIYFNLNNQTDDILNIPSVDNITLNSSGNTTHPVTILDRQSQPFAQKVLSHTQVFGILAFPATPDTQGTLTFDQMFMERTPDQIFQQQLILDFKKLNQDPKVRN